MINQPDENDDVLKPLLAERQAVDDRRTLRNAVLVQTLGVVRRRRRVRQAGWAVLLAGCYAAGLFTAPALVPQPTVRDVPQEIVAESHAPKLIAVRPPAAIPSKPTSMTSYDSMRKRADQELRDPNRLTTAVHRYSRAVALAKGPQREIDPEKDSWLLMALKLETTPEKKHVPHN